MSEQELRIELPVNPEEPTHYINNANFKIALQEYKAKRDAALAAGQELPPIPEYIGACFLKIAKGVANKHNFRNYSYINDMVSDAVMTCLEKVNKFDPYMGTSAFAYFTQCIWYSFIGFIKTEKKKEKTKRDLFFRGGFDTFSVNDEDTDFQMSYNEFIQSLGTDTDRYVSKQEKKRIQFESKATALDTLYGDEQ